MKFSCEKYLIQKAVEKASSCTAAKSPIPALEGLLIEAGSDVRITGYDLKKGIYTSFPADVAEPGSVVLSARLFGDIVRSLPDGIVTVTLDGLNASIVCEAADFSIIGSESGEYPELPSVDRQNSVSIPQNVLSRMIKQTIFAVSDNESRPVYTGSLFEIKGDTLTVVAVDGFRLALRKEVIEAGAMEDCSFIVPGSSLSEVVKLCGDTDETADITVGSKHISFVIGDTVMISRRLEGEFLNYKKSIPGDFGTTAEVSRDDLVKVVSRVSLMIDEKTKNPLRITVEEGGLDIRCRTGRGSAVDQCAAGVSGNSGVVIGFNSRYFLDALKAAPADVVKIGFNTASSPCVILPADGGDNFSYMILPVRLRAEG